MKKLLPLFFILVCPSFIFSQNNENFRLSTHILDINLGKPAPDVDIILFKLDTDTGQFKLIDSGKTDNNGRIGNFLPSSENNDGIYKLRFETHAYFSGQGNESIYPYIEVIFIIEGDGHYHIPVTVSANGYSTYRGS